MNRVEKIKKIKKQKIIHRIKSKKNLSKLSDDAPDYVKKIFTQDTPTQHTKPTESTANEPTNQPELEPETQTISKEEKSYLRLKKKRKMMQKTPRGQPLMRNQINSLLKKIKSQ
jgi:hypothetical protein